MYHIKDEEYIKGKAPMTKEEIRAVSIAKLEIRDTDICLDIGGGTGTITMEMARFARKGHIYTIEAKDNAYELIQQNIKKFKLENITLIKGEAPEDLKSLGVEFDRIFIGGSGGNLEEIIQYSYDNLKEKGILVLNFIVLENVFKTMEYLKKLDFTDTDICQIIVSKNRKVKDFNMMMAENPIYIITARK